ncbi:MAG: tryptophan synthase subunit alpha [Gammaproteobacteria bacterium]|jgi:tryptophan synthase alpha chain|nr:tryptophan synthase subunit alpha [Gammaproteobacteria bacterium]MDP6166548.1 tryptophan synthase subunit alpha [Gammaproteobacteria bacterium]
MLEQYIKDRLQHKDLLLMTHIVLGYPSYDDSMRLVESMVEAGVDLMELQIPFSEPMADGPVILKANAEALKAGATMDKSLAMAEKITAAFDIPFLFMTYYNILFKYGVEEFVGKMKDINIKGAIIPDLTPEEGSDYLQAMQKNGLDPVHIFTPNSSMERKQLLHQHTSGFMYTVARKGVTGKNTQFGDELGGYLAQCREATDLPLALGFGVKTKADYEFIRGKADVAIIGSEAIRVMEDDGVEAVGPFIRSILS